MRFFTQWSYTALAAACALTLICPCRSTRILLAVACVNALVVGVTGPAVIAYGGLRDVPAACRCNLWEHAVPMAVSVLVLLRLPRVRAEVRLDTALPLLLAFNVLYLATPHRAAVGMSKARAVYGVRNPAWLLLVPLLQAATVVAVHA